MKTDPETAFLSGLIELQYGRNVDQRLRSSARKVSWAVGWPENKEAFWNAEAFMWQRKISREKRDLIKQRLAFLAGRKNLDLGCGAYSYLPSVGFDISRKMLDFNEQCALKIHGDVEQPLPFGAGEFDSVTAVFLLNYVANYKQLLKEVRWVLRPTGVFAMILSSDPINDWQRQKEVTVFSAEQWKEQCRAAGFCVAFSEKEGLWFFTCKKI